MGDLDSASNFKNESLRRSNSKGGANIDASSEATGSHFFADAADSIAEKAQAVKLYASEMSDKISEGYQAVQTRLKAYIGPIDEAAEHTIDNKYIVRGYRINHDSVRSLCKSLFTCHNEFVNVWSHIGGVLIFLILLIVVCVQVLPNQFWYAN